MEQNIINILKKIRNQINEYVIKNNINFTTYDIPFKLNINFPILELDNNIEIGKCCIHGGTYIDVKEYYIIKPGIKIADINGINISRMLICLKNEKNQFLPIESIIHTFLHELSHTVTIPEKVLSKNISNIKKKIQPTVKNVKKNSYMPNHHSTNFYINFAKILRIAEILGIYVLPKTHRNFQIKNLQRFDSLVNPNDSMSIGKTNIKI